MCMIKNEIQKLKCKGGRERENERVRSDRDVNKKESHYMIFIYLFINI